MSKKLCIMTALLISFCLCGSAGAAIIGEPWYWDQYQLRDVSGQPDGHSIAGPQWFATTTENWWLEPAEWYRATRGGEAPAVPMVTSADLLSDFNHVFLENPRYYNAWNDMDPIESVCFVLTGGRGNLKLSFGNNYSGYHTPGRAQDAMQDVLLSVPGYTTRVTPNRPELVSRDAALDFDMLFQAESGQVYGSQLGYLTFRQSSSDDVNFTGFRESVKIPLVVANVYNGSAADSGNELYFDMTVKKGGDVAMRKKFRWGAGRNMTLDLGTFFMIQPQPSAYSVETRITNRTGTRYRAQRYDSIGGGGYVDLLPDGWSYDLPSDLYGSLPASFRLDPQSQVAPGLVTLYASSLDMTYGSNESFRLYPYQGSASPADLRLSFRKVGGMTAYGTASSGGNPAPWTLTGFKMTFADVIQNSANTADEIAAYAGGTPVMPAGEFEFGDAVLDQYVKADAFNGFKVSADVPDGLLGSHDIGLLPVQVRLRVSRKEAPIVGRWSEIENADSVLNAFANICTVWVRSEHAAEMDMNLFTTLQNRGYAAERCVQAFTYGDYLYLDFIVLLADAVSQNTGKTAFCQVVEDDGVPYILIGDGQVDGRWNLSFYVAATGSNPNPGPNPNPGNNGGGGGGGGGCNQGHGSWTRLGVYILAVLAAFPLVRKRIKPSADQRDAA